MATKRLGFEPFTDAAGKPRFRLVARNGLTLASSEAYSSERERDKGIAAARRAVHEQQDRPELESLSARARIRALKEAPPAPPEA
jgi:uncharacterized protein YegP (UPF0339 family)